MGETESIILRHSGRGMNLLREYLPEDYCAEAAKEILSWPKGIVFLTTGFYVAGFAETDGPAGTIDPGDVPGYKDILTNGIGAYLASPK